MSVESFLSKPPIASGQDWSQPEVPEAFNVHDDASANWVVRRIVECRRYAERCDEWLEREKNRARCEEDFFLFRFGPQLREYARQKIAEQGNRRKSVNLPAGTVGFRKENPKIVVDDETAVILWAKEHAPELVATVERLSKSGLNEHVEKTGELPEHGVHIEPEREQFFVK